MSMVVIESLGIPMLHMSGSSDGTAKITAMLIRYATTCLALYYNVDFRPKTWYTLRSGRAGYPSFQYTYIFMENEKQI